MAVIPGTNGDDVQTGTAADDRILASGGDDTIDGLQGFDTIDYRAAPAGINVTSADETFIFDGFGAFDRVISGVEGIFGSSFRDVIEGNAVDNRFFGFDGDDLLRGGSGNDRLDGGRGNDTLDGEEGFDTLLGRSGADVLIGGEGGGDSMLGGDGDDVLTANSDDFLTANSDEPVVMRGNAGNDAMSFVGQFSFAEVFGDNGNDLAVIVSDGGGTLSGGRGDDVLSLLADPSGSSGGVQGGPGNDTIRVELEFGEEISGGDGDDTISGIIDAGAFVGGSGDDLLTIEGGGFFSPDLLGGAGDDVLINAKELDPQFLTLDGGRGSDVLRGGAGEDVFQFSLNDRGADVVENFIASEDLLQFEDTGLQFDDVDTNDSASLDAGDEAVSSIGNDLVIDVAAAADVDFLNTVTVVDILGVAEADTLFI
jgi:Ca2+-binding RTX toxin-like protein